MDDPQEQLLPIENAPTSRLGFSKIPEKLYIIAKAGQMILSAIVLVLQIKNIRDINMNLRALNRLNGSQNVLLAVWLSVTCLVQSAIMLLKANRKSKSRLETVLITEIFSLAELAMMVLSMKSALEAPPCYMSAPFRITKAPDPCRRGQAIMILCIAQVILYLISVLQIVILGLIKVGASKAEAEAYALTQLFTPESSSMHDPRSNFGPGPGPSPGLGLGAPSRLPYSSLQYGGAGGTQEPVSFDTRTVFDEDDDAASFLSATLAVPPTTPSGAARAWRPGRGATDLDGDVVDGGALNDVGSEYDSWMPRKGGATEARRGQGGSMMRMGGRRGGGGGGEGHWRRSTQYYDPGYEGGYTGWGMGTGTGVARSGAYRNAWGLPRWPAVLSDPNPRWMRVKATESWRKWWKAYNSKNAVKWRANRELYKNDPWWRGWFGYGDPDKRLWPGSSRFGAVGGGNGYGGYGGYGGEGFTNGGRRY